MTSPYRQLGILIALQITLWTVLCSAFFTAPPLDVVENLAWGQEWQLGYYKHPPLQAWLTEMAMIVSGDKIWALYLLSQLSVVIIYLSLFWLGRDLKDAQTGFLAAGFYALCYYASIPTPEFNANSVLAMVSALIILVFWRCLSRNKLYDWVLLGVFVALGVYAKYSVAFIVFSMMIILLSYKNFRIYLFQKGLWISVAICIFLILPHLYWLYQHEFLPFSYAVSRTPSTDGAMRFIAPLKFSAAQILDYIIPILLLVVFRKSLKNPELSRGTKHFVYGVAFLPVILIMIYALFESIKPKDMWGYGLVTFISLVMALWARNIIEHKWFKYAQNSMLGLLIILPFITVVLGAVLPSFGVKPHKSHWPGKDIGAALEKHWQENMGTPSPDLIIGPTWEAGLASFYLPDRPTVYFDAKPKHNPWVSQEKLDSSKILHLWRGGNNPYNAPAEGIKNMIEVMKGTYPIQLNYMMIDAQMQQK